jgi:type IV pilus assembly protein PilV
MLTRRPLPTATDRQSGSALLEALISVLIFSIALIGLIGIQGQALKQNLQAKFRNDAGFIATRVIGDIQLDAANYVTYGNATITGTTYDSTTASGFTAGSNQRQWADAVANTLPGGRIVVFSNAAETAVTVTVSWVPSGETASVSTANYRHQFVLVSRVNVLDI